MRLRIVILPVTLLFLLSSVPVSGQYDPDKIAFKDLSEVYVLVEYLPEDADRIFLSRPDIQNRAELVLHRNRVPVKVPVKGTDESQLWIVANLVVTECVFRGEATTHFAGKRPPISEQKDRVFQGKVVHFSSRL